MDDESTRDIPTPASDFASESNGFKLACQPLLAYEVFNSGSKTKLTPCNSDMTSPIFTIMAKNGGNNKMLVHQAVLQKSVVFKAMGNGPFQEGQTRQINFPEDDYYQMSCLLQFMYTDGEDVQGYLLGSSKPDASLDPAVSFGAQLYILANKYEIPNMEEELAHALLWLSAGESHDLFFKLAKFIHDNVPGSIARFRARFKDVMQAVFEDHGDIEYVGSGMEAIIIDGGTLARDIVQVLQMCWETRR